MRIKRLRWIGAKGAAAHCASGELAAASGGGGRRTSWFSMLRGSIRLEFGRGGREQCGELIWVIGAAIKCGGGSYGGELGGGRVADAGQNGHPGRVSARA